MRYGFIQEAKGRTLWLTGWTAMLAGSMIGLVERHHPGFLPDVMDGVYGLCMGVFIAAMGMTVWRARR